MRILVCDDDKVVLGHMNNMLKQILTSVDDKVILCSTLSELNEKLERHECDLLLLDIAMQEEKNGIDFASELFCRNADVAVIYITGYALEYINRVFYRPANIIGFLTKPVAAETLKENIERARAQIAENRRHQLIVSINGKIERVDCREIIYLESKAHHVMIHTQERSVQVYGKLSEIMEKLPGQFYQFHKSYVVNMDKVTRVERMKISLQDGTVLPVSRTYQDRAKELYMKYMKENMQGKVSGEKRE